MLRPSLPRDLVEGGQCLSRCRRAHVDESRADVSGQVDGWLPVSTCPLSLLATRPRPPDSAPPDATREWTGCSSANSGRTAKGQGPSCGCFVRRERRQSPSSPQGRLPRPTGVPDAEYLSAAGVQQCTYLSVLPRAFPSAARRNRQQHDFPNPDTTYLTRVRPPYTMATMPPLTLQYFSDNLRKYVTQYRDGLLHLFPDDFSNTYGARAKAMVETLVSYHCPFEMALQFSVLVLFDLVILLGSIPSPTHPPPTPPRRREKGTESLMSWAAIDDSTSMDYGDDGRRRMTLLTVLEAIADIYVLAREEGIMSVHFLNTRMPWRNVRPNAVKDLHSRIQYNGVTMIGTQLQEKVLRRYVQQPERMEKPLLTMVITDGEVPPRFLLRVPRAKR